MADSPAVIPDGYETSVCALGAGEATCAFLTFGGDLPEWRCAKSSEIEPLIRARLAEGTMAARGDNCSGPPDYRPIGEEQA